MSVSRHTNDTLSMHEVQSDIYQSCATLRRSVRAVRRRRRRVTRQSMLAVNRNLLPVHRDSCIRIISRHMIARAAQAVCKVTQFVEHASDATAPAARRRRCCCICFPPAADAPAVVGAYITGTRVVTGVGVTVRVGCASVDGSHGLNARPSVRGHMDEHCCCHAAVTPPQSRWHRYALR